MAAQSHTLVEPLVRETIDRSYCGRKTVLVLLSLLISFDFAASLVRYMNWRDRQDKAVQEPAIDITWMSRQPPQARRFLEPTMAWQVPKLGMAWHAMQSMQPQPVRAMQQVATFQSMHSATANVPLLSKDLENIDDMLQQEYDMLQSKDAAIECPGNSGQVTELIGLEEFLFAQQCNAGRTVVLKFFSSRCRTCLATGIRLAKMAKEFPDVRFFKMKSREENRIIFQSFNITRVPVVEVFHGDEGKADRIGWTENMVSEVKEKLFNLREEDAINLRLTPS